MATENIVLLLFAAGLGALHLIGGSLSGVWRPPSRAGKRPAQRAWVGPNPASDAAVRTPPKGGGAPPGAKESTNDAAA